LISAAWRHTWAIFLALAWASSALAAEDKATLNFVNADIAEVIRAISHISKKNFLVDPRVKGTINIVSATPVSSEQAYNILLSALRLQGFAAVDSNGVTKVMPEADAKLYIGEVNTGHGVKDQLVTRIFPLQYESAAQMVNIVRPLIAANNIVVAYPNTNTLVVTDYASNLKRIEQIVHSIDQPGADATVTIPVQHLSAMDLAQTLNRLMQDAAPGGATDGSNRFILLADARSNTLLLRSSNPDRVARVRDLVKKLDVKTSTPGNIHVVYLKNADATKVAQTLRSVMSGEVSSAAMSATMPTAMQNPSPTQAQSSGGGGMIQADAASNALIIIAPEAVYNNLRSVVDMLDVRRAQVFVEALIAEVSADKTADFGIQWQGVTQTTGGRAYIGGGTNFGGTGVNIIGVGASAKAGIPVLSQGLNVGLLRGLNLGALASALETDASANILSTPNLLTLDNEEAKIVIGQNVPFITGSYAQTGGNANTASPFQTIDRKDVGLTLKIKPQISEGGTVKLQIYQEVSSVDANSMNNPAGLITNKRSLDSSVLVDEGQTVVLGGLIQDQVSTSETKVPLLGSIPFLGALFRYETRQHNKTNLMIFIRPHVLRSKNAGDSLTQDRYDYLRTEEANSQASWNLILPSMTAPQLPAIDFPKPASAPVADVARKESAADADKDSAASAVPATVSQPSANDAPAAASQNAATGGNAAH